jgi:hypothetical protein
MRLDDELNSFLIWSYFYQRIFSDARSDENTARVAEELIVFRTLNMLVTNTTELSSLPLRCSTSCSRVLKIQFPLPCWRFWQIVEIYSFVLIFTVHGSPQCSVISGTPVTGFAKPWRYDKWCCVGSVRCVIGVTSGELDIRGFSSVKAESFTFTASR